MPKMIGIFDSGAGGLFALSELRAAKPLADLCFFADTANSPYGTREQGEIARLLSAGISRLKCAGCEAVLIACCTASSVIDMLKPQERHGAVPIILPTALAAVRATRRARIAVISTEATHRSAAFGKAIAKIAPKVKVISRPTQALVSLVEAGACDANITASARRALEDELAPLLSQDFDTLILGCTHFAHLEHEIRRLAGDGVAIISSAKEGVAELLRTLSEDELCGAGSTIYLR